jgi:ubiquitin-protein ligase
VLSPRMQRLAADHRALRAVYSGHPRVHVEPLGALPPSRYRVTFRIPGLRLEKGTPVATEHHVVEIQLPLEYPRGQPYCAALTPIFHPNITTRYCIGDYWAAGQSLADIVAKLGAMIQYRLYNVSSPLDPRAAEWARLNSHQLPVGDIDLGVPELDIGLRTDADAGLVTLKRG